MHLQNSFLLFTFTLFLSGCDIFFFHHKSQDTKNVSIVNQPKQFAILGPMSDANVTVSTLDNNEIIYTTKTESLNAVTSKLVWGNYKVGSFTIDINTTIPSSRWLKVAVNVGEDIDSNDDGVVTDERVPLEGEVRLYCKVGDLNAAHLIINVFTTLGSEFYLYDRNTTSLDLENYLNQFAQSIFSQSIDDNYGIDYRDLFAYIPNHTSNKHLIMPNIYAKLQEYGIMNAILNNEDLIQKLHEDSDGDGLSLWDEILHNSSPYLVDSDGDGIDDYDEVQRGLNPALKDSDSDGIEDNDEQLYGTSALNSDTDGDYLPDNVEILNATDPLNADEDGNDVADGLDGDPFFKYQWYLKSLGNVVANTVGQSTVVGNDLNILAVYHKVLGNSSGSKRVIQVIDTGVELRHEDIDVDLNNSFNAVTKGQDPTATQGVSKNDPASPLYSGHGTAVAGIIAAKTNNGLGVRGIVPYGKIAGSNWLENQTLGELDRVWYSQINDDKVVVSNNSWGAYYLKNDSFERMLALGTAQLRNNKGRVYVFAAGNERENFGNSNLSYLTNNPYVIAVASLNAQDKYASYSSPGSNILVSAYGGEHYYSGPTIMTSSLMGESYYEDELGGRKGVITVDEDTQKNYTYAMNGTSSAAPMVSGSIALVLDACPSLSWRDVRLLIAKNAVMVDKRSKSWVKNGVGLYHSNDYGFGKINPLGMINMCRSVYFEPLGAMQSFKVTKEYSNTLIPDNNTTIRKTINFENDLKIEWVGLTIDTPHPFSGDLEINLISPIGTKINIIEPNEIRFAGYENGFRFSTVGFMDESSQGQWSVEITDKLEKDEGVLKSITLEVYGHED